MAEATQSVEGSRRIHAPASHIFSILADPRRHHEFDGSNMVRGALVDGPVTGVGDIFAVSMHRLGRDYTMVNLVVEFVRDRRIVWSPGPGDLPTAGGDPARVGVPAGYRWGYVLTPDGPDATLVTEVFDCGTEGNGWILRDGGEWINGSTTVLRSMSTSLELLEGVSTAR